jgi:glutamate synthase (NADPH/NADH) large chain
MTGGKAFVLDETGDFLDRCNTQMETPVRIEDAADIAELQNLIYRHLENTESSVAQNLLADWQNYLPKFWVIEPNRKVPPAAEAPALALKS